MKGILLGRFHDCKMPWAAWRPLQVIDGGVAGFPVGINSYHNLGRVEQVFWLAISCRANPLG
jgi:hypothetical protein